VEEEIQNSKARYSFFRRVLPNTAWFSATQLAVRGLDLLILPVMTFYLSPEDYGVLAVVALIVEIINIMADWGFGVGLRRNYFDHQGDKLKEFLFTVLVTVGLSSLLWYGAALLFGPPLGSLVAADWQSEFAGYLRLGVIAAGLLLTQSVITDYLMTAGRAKHYSFLVTCTEGARIAVQLILLIAFGLGLRAVLYAAILGGALKLLIGIALTWRDMKPRLRPKIISEIWKVGWATLPISGLGYLVRQGNRWVLQALLPLSALGLYSFGAKFEDLQLKVNESVKGAWRPVNFQMLSEDADDRELGKHATYLLELLILVMALVALFSKEVIVLFAQESFHAAFVIVPILAFGALVRTFSIVPYYRMIHEKKLPYALLTLIPSAIVTLVVSWLLIPQLGILGAALGAAANYIAMLVFHFIWAAITTKRGVRVPYARLGLLLGGAAIAVAVGVIQPGDFSWAWLGIKALVFVALIALIAWLERQRISAVLRDIRERRGVSQ